MLRTLHGILATTPRSIPLHSSKNAACLESLLSSRSVIADWLGVAPLRNRPMLADDDGGGSTSLDSEVKELAEIASHLHLAGLSAREIGWLTYKSGQAYREEIYRGTNFDETNLYGPYEQRTDGRLVIDWKMLNGIAVVMALNVHGAWHQVRKLDGLLFGLTALMRDCLAVGRRHRARDPTLRFSKSCLLEAAPVADQQRLGVCHRAVELHM